MEKNEMRNAGYDARMLEKRRLAGLVAGAGGNPNHGKDGRFTSGTGAGSAEGDYSPPGQPVFEPYGRGYDRNGNEITTGDGNGYHYADARTKRQIDMAEAQHMRSSNYITREEYKNRVAEIEGRFAAEHAQEQYDYQNAPQPGDSIINGIQRAGDIASKGIQAINKKVSEIDQRRKDVQSVTDYAKKAGKPAPGRGVTKLLGELRKSGYKVTGSDNQAKNLLIDGAEIDAETNPIKKKFLVIKLSQTYEKDKSSATTGWGQS